MQAHHIGIVHLDSGNSSLGVTQPKKEKKETIGDQKANLNYSKHYDYVRSGSIGGTKMKENEDHVEGTTENQVNEEQSTFGFQS